MSIINKLVLSAAVLLTAAGNSFSQTFSNTPNDTINMVGLMEDLETLTIQQLNISSNTIQLKWKKVSVSVPALWDASVCDNSICYTSLVDSGTMNPVNPPDYGFILLHVTPHVNYGTAVIRYAVWDISNPSLKDTLTFILTVNAPSSVNEAESKKAFSVFPNPVRESIKIVSNVYSSFQFLITDIYGKEIQKGFSKTNSITLNTENIPNGVYNISISFKDKITGTKKFILQH
jgi:Secretion system C-terminal sorting domain